MEHRKPSKIHRVIDRFLGHLNKAHINFNKILHKNKNMSMVYKQLDHMIKSQLISLDKDSKLIHSPDLHGLTDTITENIVQKIPNVSEDTIKSVVSQKTPKNFLEMITRGIDPLKKDIEYTLLKKEKLIKKVLVANRGEIALRIIRACKELGIKVVVIYTKSDRDTLAVKFADQAFLISNDDSVKAYLDIRRIVNIAKKSRCDAVHPGYGFLSENSEFAKLCSKNKIKFIGPPFRSIELMGNKARARELMIKNNIPVVTGTKRALENVNIGLSIANKIGYPVMIKAASGGGGKGMRIVRKQEEFIKNFNSAKSEAEASFGDGSMYIEKYVEDPKHIEFQILADNYNNIIHLGERECTIQRRHQKLVEEAPSPILTKELREQMGSTAVKIAHLAKYEGAGTIEFLVDKNKNFYFMEMNTRIQVEHGVTEMITNVDLIKEQVKIASGAKLAYKQEDIKIDSWAIECRINAECPYEDFAPSPGTITEYLPPGGPGIRVCSSCHTGHKITPQYDSLIAKLMCSGKNREEAIDRMKRALGEYIINGVKTTIPFHIQILTNKKFISGDFTTSFIDDENIMKQLKKSKAKKNGITREQKMVIVSTAISKYLERKNSVRNNNKAWQSAARQDIMDTEGEIF